jgi:hypothetical protein
LMPGSVLDCDKLFIDVGWEFDPLCPMDWQSKIIRW